MTTHADSPRLAAALDELATRLTRFASALDAEREGLRGATDALLDAVRAKDAAATEVEAAFARLRDAAAGASLEALAGMPALSDRVARVRALARDCERTNRTHGRLLAMRRRATEDALGLLVGQGRRGGAGGDVYDARGRRTGGGAPVRSRIA